MIVISDEGFVTRTNVFHCLLLQYTGQLEDLWLVRSTLDHMVEVLAWDTVLCFSARHFTHKVPLSTQEYIWLPVS